MADHSYKRALVEYLDGNEDISDKVYKFQVLLPNGISVHLTLRNPQEEMFFDEFMHLVKKEAQQSLRTGDTRRKILWNGDLYLEDMRDYKIKKRIFFSNFKPNKLHLLRLHDELEESADTFRDMWDLTPDTDLLAELPAEYNFETALADLIDNSLQAVWSNNPGQRKLIRVIVQHNKVSIFDTGLGMDCSDDNSISKWGRMGSSNNRSSRHTAIGGTPPYLMPFFGMFGYGGLISSMHLGRRVVVSSKTKEAKKVCTLHLSRDALLRKSTSNSIWKTDGGLRRYSAEEMKLSPHGSFTQVEIHELKMRPLDTIKLQCLLKDIYFPYIQYDDECNSRKTRAPIEFEVNDRNLAEVEGGEVCRTNWHSSNGPNFILQLCFRAIQSESSSGNYEAHAQLKCVYFPIVEGKENINRILEKLDQEGHGLKEDFNKFCRVSIRRLGRLLPDARWGALPFMEPKQKKGEKAQLLKRCSKRIKCFVETDAGFSPTPSKNNLAHHHPFTLALKNFGNTPSEKDAVVDIRRDGKRLTISQLEREYQEWVIQMHVRYDQEVEHGEDEPVLVIDPCNKKRLGINAGVVRVHKAIRRNGRIWRSGENVKIVKGAVGCGKNNVYATLEYILLEGFDGDLGGEARLICRKLDCPVDKGCKLLLQDGGANLDIQDSLSFPISIIDEGKFLAIDQNSWDVQIAKHKEKLPGKIDILSHLRFEQPEINGTVQELPSFITAGSETCSTIVAIIRPASFTTSCTKILDQKFIVKDDLEMHMEILSTKGGKKFGDSKSIYKQRAKPVTMGGIHGFYTFSLVCEKLKFFNMAGVYKFLFSVSCKDSSCIREERTVTVKPDPLSGKWKILHLDGAKFDNSMRSIHSGSCISRISLAFVDSFSNKIPLTTIPKLQMKISSEEYTLSHVRKFKANLSSDQMSLELKEILIVSDELDNLRPHYKAKLEIFFVDASFTVVLPLKVQPGLPSSVKMHCMPELEKRLFPGYVIEELALEMFDAYGNHLEEGTKITISVDGVCFVDGDCTSLQVNREGFVILTGLLKVQAGYGSNVRIYICVDGRLIFDKYLPVFRRELRVVSILPDQCSVGSCLENVVFGVFDSQGAIDQTIDGIGHTLSISSESMKKIDTVLYKFELGYCTVPVVPVPKETTFFKFSAHHTSYPELSTTVELNVLQTPQLEFVPTDNMKDGIVISSSVNEELLQQDSFQLSSSQIELLESFVYYTGKLEEEVAEVGYSVAQHEINLKRLKNQKEAYLNEIFYFEGLVDKKFLSQVLSFNTRQQIQKRLEEKGNTVAAEFLRLSDGNDMKGSHFQFMEDVIGIVGLLGAVNDCKLSRTLAEYLGEDRMLAIVCRSYTAAFAIEKYKKEIMDTHNLAMHAAAGIRSHQQFTAYCLDEIRPYVGKLLYNDPQRKLALPDPKLPSGGVPDGFLGYAVNMIELEEHHLNMRNATGYGLRETLFYRLFGELQVYKSGTEMHKASTCTRHGAISLDGGILMHNGIVMLGNSESEIQFPVVTVVQRMLSKDTITLLRHIREKKADLEAKTEEIESESKALSKALAKFHKKKAKLQKILTTNHREMITES